MVRNGDADKPIWISEMNWNAVPDEMPCAANCAALIEAGQVLFRQTKMLLPTYDVFDEWRNFQPATRQDIATFRGRRMDFPEPREAVVADHARERRRRADSHSRMASSRTGVSALFRSACGRATIAKPALYPAARASIHSMSGSVVCSVSRFELPTYAGPPPPGPSPPWSAPSTR